MARYLQCASQRSHCRGIQTFLFCRQQHRPVGLTSVFLVRPYGTFPEQDAISREAVLGFSPRGSRQQKRRDVERGPGCSEEQPHSETGIDYFLIVCIEIARRPM